MDKEMLQTIKKITICSALTLLTACGGGGGGDGGSAALVASKEIFPLNNVYINTLKRLHKATLQSV